MKKGVLLVNLGSPNSTKVKDVRKYLREFLMDKNVIDIPYIIRKLVVELFILTTRPPKSAKAYAKIWWKEGSPLVVISQRLTDKAAKLTKMPVHLGMRYGNPSIEHGIRKLAAEGVTDVLVIPLYPQYAMSTTETVQEKVEEIKAKHFNEINFSYFPSFYNNEDYIEALANKIKKNLPADVDALLFSYHGIPERHIYKTDKEHKTCKIGNCCFQEDSPSHATCYRHQCYKVTSLVSEKLGLSNKFVYQTFQSRLGRDPWLRPYTDYFLEEVRDKNIKNLAVVAPAFVSDCLETLEELSMEGKEQFESGGGENYHYIPCLNDDDEWVAVVAKWMNEWAEEKKV